MAIFFYVLPLSIGRLDGIGAFPDLFGFTARLPTSTSVTRDAVSAFCGKPGFLDTKRAAEVLPVKHPTLQVFQAEVGDSALLRWGEVAILIDGGNSSDPCFASQLSPSDTVHVFLTHGDRDHINGLSTFFKATVENRKLPKIERKPWPRVESLNGLFPTKKAIAQASKDAFEWLKTAFSECGIDVSAKDLEKAKLLDGSRTWADVVSLMNTDDQVKINQEHDKPFSKGMVWTFPVDTTGKLIKVTAVWPGQSTTLHKDFAEIGLRYLVTARALLELAQKVPSTLNKAKEKEEGVADNLTLINWCSLVLLVECMDGGECVAKMLFTGDAPAQPAVAALGEGQVSLDDFDYVDVPHHGSDKNLPEKMEPISSKIFLCSTSGTKHGHPNRKAVEMLAKKANPQGGVPSPTTHVLFNHRDVVQDRVRKHLEKMGPGLKAGVESKFQFLKTGVLQIEFVHGGPHKVSGELEAY
eukprot:TRINITY_DN1297_c0_g1_i1.p1 TRINITY_DN1297_c0_g1~~TRINITY_DN1297_c0_g1_i1.p1  ORF type:complete len:468 (-),score=88.04 TRINITY_DN1297_c0_g1_i1:58-1461(-)